MTWKALAILLISNICFSNNLSRVMKISISDKFINNFKDSFVELISERFENSPIPDTEGWYGYLNYKAFNIYSHVDKIHPSNVLVDLNQESQNIRVKLQNFRMQVNFDLSVSFILFSLECHVDLLVLETKLTTKISANKTNDNKLAINISSELDLNKEDIDIRFSNTIFAFLLNYVKNWFINVLFLKVHLDYQMYEKKYENIANQLIFNLMKEYTVSGPFLMEYSLIELPKVKRHSIELSFECFTYFEGKKDKAIKPPHSQYEFPAIISSYDFNLVVSDNIFKSAFETAFNEGMLIYSLNLNLNVNSNTNVNNYKINFKCNATSPIKLYFNDSLSLIMEQVCNANFTENQTNQTSNFLFYSKLNTNISITMESNFFEINLSQQNSKLEDVRILANDTQINWFTENINLFTEGILQEINSMMNRDKIVLCSLNFVTFPNLKFDIQDRFLIISSDIKFSMADLRKLVYSF